MRRAANMYVPTLIMGLLALALVGIGVYRGHGEPVAGLKSAALLTLQVLPLLLFAFVIAGMIQALLPREQVARWVGAEAGARGIWIGTLVGAVAPGGPYVSLPIAATLVRAGAGAGTLVAFLTAWSLWAVARLPMEVAIIGWRLTLIRFASTFFFPPIAGWIAQVLARRMGGG